MKLPSTGEPVKYRPFLVKEEKILLMAMESGKQKDIQNALNQIINSCTDGKLDVVELPMFDIEYLFLQLRIKSVEDKAKVTLKCERCGEPVGSEIDLNKVQVQFPEEKTNFNIPLTSDVGVTMKYPTMKMMKNMGNDTENAEQMFDLIATCVDSIYDGEQVYKDFTKKEVNEFIGELPQEQFKKISAFFENMPKLKHDVKFTCPKCKAKNELSIQGLQDFFESASLTTT